MKWVIGWVLLSCVFIASPAFANPSSPSMKRHVDLGTTVALTDQQFREHAARARDPDRNTLQKDGLAVDTANRFAVISFYRNTYLASQGWEGRMGWIGNIGACDAGTVSAAYHADTLRRINYFRAMAGLPGDIVFAAAKNADCQQTALTFSRNSAISHSPPPSWHCWTWTGSNAASKANTAIGCAGPDAIDMYMNDSGGDLYDVGHRRWLLYSCAAEMGNGGVPNTSHAAAAALWVIGDFRPTPPAVPFVAWPPKGYVPYTVVYPRWSFGIPGAPLSAFDHATVTMTKNGAPMTARIVHPTGTSPAAGYGDPTIVWEPVGLPVGAPGPDVVYVVTIGNVAGVSPSSYTYTVRVVDPNDASDAYEFDGNAASAKTIAKGQTQNHTMHVAGDVDWVKFTVGGSGASNVRLETSGASGDTHMWLFGPDNASTLVAYDNDSGTGSFSLITRATLAPGTYYLGIRENGDNAMIAAYTLQANWTGAAGPTPDPYEYDGNAASAKPIANGQTQNHSMHVAGDVDWVKFTVGGAGATGLRVETSGAGGDTHMWLFGPNSAGTLVAYDDESGAGSFSLITRASLAPGTYYLGIREYGDDAAIAAYAVRVAWTARPDSYLPDVWENDNTAAAANAILNGAVHGHSIHAAGDVDWTRFTIGAAGALNLSIDTYGTGADDTQMWLFGPDSATACIAYDDNSGAGNFSQITAAGVRGGTYYVKVKEFGNNGTIQAYNLRTSWTPQGTPDVYEPNNTIDQSTAVANGGYQSHSIHVNGDTDWFWFTAATSGTFVWLETYGTLGDTEMWLFGPDAGVPCIFYDDNSGNDSCARIFAGPLRAGTYFFKIKERGNNGTIASYTLYTHWW